MGDTLLCLNCCITEQPQPKRQRRRIDRSMIGAPTDFRHTTHVGSGDVSNNASNLNSIQGQMSSKGGYDHHVSPGHLQLDVVDLPTRNNR
ncbi:hypothetical protein SNE40_007233 [Patella caerulea]|uniref:CRIB domain-containing protein n=1 Tax=Patella caerulea TaxID=87958 RepID=A0AAN8JXI5_PATCE